MLMELWEIRQASIPILGLSMGDAHNELTLLHLRLIRLRNGLEALLICDPDVNDVDDESTEEDNVDRTEDTNAQCESDMLLDLSNDSQYNCTGLGSEDFVFNAKRRLGFHPDEEGGPSRTPILKTIKLDKLTNRFRQGKQRKHPNLGKESKKAEEPEKDLTIKNAAAAMCVGVGSMADPPEAQGLAHYLEHMLFMGSTKFPDENEYDKFLSQHGGNSNAYTDQEFTCFYFDVRNRNLRDALDRFAQFFLSPLVKVDAMDREIQAIESEFVQAAGNDMNRLCQVQCYTALPSHPFHRFSWGNKKSLHDDPVNKGIDMRAKLLQLYHEDYRAGRMKLVILGGDSLDTLQNWVVSLFGQIKEGGDGRLIIHGERRIWEPNRMYRVAAGTEQNLVALNFPLPCLETAYLTKPHDYFGHIIGHEGQGSLLALLRRKGWARSMTAGCGDNGLETNQMLFLFTIRITLTNHGVEHVMEVIGLLFQYLKMLRSLGPQEWIFQEQNAVSKLNFEHFEDPAQDDYVASLATNMFLYTKAHVLYGDYAHDIWDPAMITELLAQLIPVNMRADLLLHRFDKTSSDVQMEPWFETAFTVETIPTALLKLWADPPCVDSSLRLQEPNMFIPHDITIVPSKEDGSKNPSCLLDSAALKVWHRCNPILNTPRVNACFSIMFWPPTKKIIDAVLAELYLIRLSNQLNETLYLADVAKLETSLSLSGYRIELKIFGFSEKLPVLAQKIASQMQNLASTELEFKSSVEVLAEEYKRANEKPIDHAAYLLTQALSKRFWDVDHRYNCLQILAFQDFTKFVANLFCKTYIECFVDGNATKKQALALAKIFKEALVSCPFPLQERPTNCVVRLPTGTSMLYMEKVKCEFEKNSVVHSYFQLGQDRGKDSMRLRSLMTLFIDIISEPFFNQLRTKEQIGYVVDLADEDLHGVLGISFMVQSAKYSPAYIESRINAFIKTIPKMLKDMKDTEFQSHKESLIAEKQGYPSTLIDESNDFWEQIWTHRRNAGIYLIPTSTL
ncbi:nardilysin-like isoform X2 [Physcomitrium patens]|uniref:nardilysin-like isoform X2 n=1 Tax=Physcomitrium patens TaxID=3218 RepID=UPI003CCC91B7